MLIPGCNIDRKGQKHQEVRDHRCQCHSGCSNHSDSHLGRHVHVHPSAEGNYSGKLGPKFYNFDHSDLRDQQTKQNKQTMFVHLT